jgi:predicted HD superfamily hydrolase involved in NAD metabolism
MNNNFTEEMLDKLRKKVGEGMSEKRYFHTLEVENMAARLGAIYVPECIPVLRAAALLHDITKEKSAEEHIAIFEQNGVLVSESDKKSPKMFHAKTAALVIPGQYAEFATLALISAVRYHTTGRADMTILEKIIYLADYIDMSRKFSDCVELRDFFFNFDFESASEEEKVAHLNQTLIKSYDFTIRGLIDDGKLIDKTTLEARNFLIMNS